MIFEYHASQILLWIILLLILLLSIYVSKNHNIIQSLNIIIKTTTLNSSSITYTSDCFSSVLPLSGLPLVSTPSEDFVTFCNNNPKYLALLVHYFSTRPMIAYGIYIGADILVNWNLNILFDLLHRWSCPFLLRAWIPMREGHFFGANFDETGINVLLCQAKVNHTLCKIDLYFSYLSAYKSNQNICHEHCHSAYIFIHGSKDANIIYNLVERLKKRVGSPFIPTSLHGFHYSNETQYTCCYPDSQRSSEVLKLVLRSINNNFRK